MGYTLHLGNCVDIMKSLDTGIVDLTVTSPPYDNLREYKGYSFDFESVAKQLWWITKAGGVVVWVVNDATVNGSETGTSFKQALFFKSLGFNLHDTMIYMAEKPPQTNNRYEQKFEYMFVFSKGKPKTFNPIREACTYAGQTPWAKRKYRQGDGSLKEDWAKGAPTKDTKPLGNVWKYDIGFNKTTHDKEAFQHPAIFPDALAEDHIISWSNPGDTVLDPFTGSGTTGKMAVLNNRNFIGIEIAKEYYDIAEKRIREAANSLVTE